MLRASITFSFNSFTRNSVAINTENIKNLVWLIYNQMRGCKTNLIIYQRRFKQRRLLKPEKKNAMRTPARFPQATPKQNHLNFLIGTHHLFNIRHKIASYSTLRGWTSRFTVSALIYRLQVCHLAGACSHDL